MPETGDNYVRKDVFDARMDRMEMLLEKTLMEMKADNEQLRSEMRESNAQLRTEMEQLRSEMKAEISGLRTEMREGDAQLRAEIKLSSERADRNFLMLNTRIDDVQTGVYWGFALVSLVVTLIALSPTLSEFLKSLRRPALTREDVEAIVSAALDRRAGGA